MFFENVLRDFFGIGTHSRKELTEKVAHAATGLDFEMAIAGHENWKLRLQAFLEGTSTEVFASEQICFDDRCDLGKWIYSTGRAKLGSFPGFTALQGHHKMFHYAASNVVSLNQAGKNDDARKMLDNQFNHFSEQVVDILTALRKISASRKPR